MKNFKFEKYQRAILGTSSPDFVAILEKKFGNIFPWVFYVLKTASKKKLVFGQNRINIPPER